MSTPSGYMRALSGMPISRPSRLYAQLWYGHVIDEPQLPAGSNSSPDARCRQLLRKPLISPSAVRTTSTDWAPMRPVMKSPGLLQVLGVAEPDPRAAEDADHLEVEQVAVVDLPRLQHR